MFRLITLITLINAITANPFYHKSNTNIYDVDINIYDNYNCSNPFSSYNYTFKCDPKHNTTDCCLSEFNKLNTTFGPGNCMRFENNESFVSFGCRFNSTSSTKEYNKLVTAVVSGGIIVGLGVIVVLIVCCVVRGTRRSYNQL